MEGLEVEIGKDLLTGWGWRGILRAGLGLGAEAVLRVLEDLSKGAHILSLLEPRLGLGYVSVTHLPLRRLSPTVD